MNYLLQPRRGLCFVLREVPVGCSEKAKSNLEEHKDKDKNHVCPHRADKEHEAKNA
jgi:hypothetical protein